MPCPERHMIPNHGGRHYWHRCALPAGHDGPHQALVTWT